ncbi:acyl-CoA thioesterase [Qipengyuania sp.]|uniref:acyl-CoA thioesterase n=1 Tax=Qipengyuania sp. TaxID=2004515 RepID=UPI003516EC24
MSVGRFPFWRVVPKDGSGQRSGRFTLPVMPPATAGAEGAPHVMGGVALAAIVDSMELDSELPLLWAQVHFLGPTQHAEELAIEVEQCGGGQAVAQYAASASVNGRPTHRASGALGAREPSEQTLFAEMPDVPGPDAATAVEISHSAPGGLPDQFDYRIALQDEARGLQAVWTRSRAEFAVDAGWLAIISDLFLGAHPATRGGSSLDAMFRFVQGCDPGWVLSVTELAAFDRGVVHGAARHFAADGRLLAISSQTGVLPRIPRAP